MRSALVDRPIDPSDLLAEVARTSNGATILFIGTVREVNDGRTVTGIEYSAYRSMAECEMAEIVSEASQRFATRDIVVEHRLGALELGDASIMIAVAHPHRGLAYEASRFVIEQIKLRVPIWKLEHYVDGSREWVNAGTGKKEPGSEAAVEVNRAASSVMHGFAPGMESGNGRRTANGSRHP